MPKKRNKYIYQFFKQLLEECEQENVYSVIETVQKMGHTYEEVKQWANADDEFAEVLDFCRQLCFTRADKDGCFGRIPVEMHTKYVCENDDEWKAAYERYVSIHGEYNAGTKNASR